MADVQNHYVFQWFCMILTGGFAWSIHHPGVVFLLTSSFFYWQMSKNIAFSIDFQGFAEFMPLNGLSPAEGQCSVARYANMLLFPMILHDSYRIQGWFFFCQVRWRPWARTGPAAANVVPTHGSAGIHASPCAVPGRPARPALRRRWFFSLTDVRNHCFSHWFSRFCWIHAFTWTFPSRGPMFCCQTCKIVAFSNGFAWCIQHRGVVSFLTSSFLYWQMCEIIAFSNDFQGFAAFM